MTDLLMMTRINRAASKPSARDCAWSPATISCTLRTEIVTTDSYYESRLQGEPAEEVADIHFHPTLLRTARLNLIVTF